MSKQEENRRHELGADLLMEWDKIHRIASAIKEGKAAVVKINGKRQTVTVDSLARMLKQHA